MRPLLAAALLLTALLCACDKPPTSNPEPTPKQADEAPKQADEAPKQADEAPKKADEAPPKAADAPPKADADPNTPDAAAKRYLTLGAKGDLSKLKPLIDPACEGSPVADVNAVKMLGARMTLDDVQTSIGEVQGELTHVNYTVKGSVTAQESHTETNLGGQKIEIKASSISMEGVTQSGSLPMKKLDGAWVVTCP
jgi:hypothetical protein